jgi:hypothetical protein
MPESLERRFQADCDRPTVIALPMFSSLLHIVEIGDERRPCATTESDPALCAVALPAGNTAFAVDLPTFSTLLKWLVSGATRAQSAGPRGAENQLGNPRSSS